MALEIRTIPGDARKLTQSLVQVMQMLDLYQAEVARILHLQCADISRMAEGRSLLEHNTQAWDLAREFIRFYQLLYQYHDAHGVAMRNWLRRRHNVFLQTPHLMLVDENRIRELIDWLESHQPNSE